MRSMKEFLNGMADGLARLIEICVYIIVLFAIGACVSYILWMVMALGGYGVNIHDLGGYG